MGDNDHIKHHFKAGSYIFLEGEEDNGKVYIVEQGQVELTNSKLNYLRTSEIAKAGDIFGFITSLTYRPRMTSAFTKVDATLLELNRDEFLNLLHKKSQIALKIMDTFAEKLRTCADQVMNSGKGYTIEPEQGLNDQANYFIQNNNYKHAYYVLHKYLQHYPEGEFKRDTEMKLNELKNRGISAPLEPTLEGKLKVYQDNQILFCENEPGDELFIIYEGKVKIIKATEEKEIILSVLKEGDIFGELAIISNKPRNATAVSFGITKVLHVNYNSFNSLLDQSPDIMKKIFISISHRVWFNMIRLEAKLFEKPLTRVYALLENKLIEENISLRSSKPHVFKFGLDELLNMAELRKEELGDSLNELLNNQALKFQFGEIVVERPKLFASIVKAHKERDHLSIVNLVKKDSSS